MRAAVIGLLMLTASCGDPQHTADLTNRVGQLESELNSSLANEQALSAEVATLKDKASRRSTKVSAKHDAGDDQAAAISVTPAASIPVSRCWQDYCPCDQDAEIDHMLCRNLRGGVEVTKEMMASGAAMRDARQAMDRYNSEYPDK